ncbi:MAG: hypothetical protein ABIZ04_25725 [Opitutus sp.]
MLLALVGLAAQAQTTPSPSPQAGELTVVIVESAATRSLLNDSYDRLSRVFLAVLEERKWPLKIKDERFGANQPQHDLELRVYYQGITRDTPQELTFRASMMFFHHGEKQDLGVIRYTFSPRPGEMMDESLDKVVAGAARIAADRIEPTLFPQGTPHR